MTHRKRISLALGVLCLVGAMISGTLGGCAPKAAEEPTRAAGSDANSMAASIYLPAVIETENGVKVQRTPDETPTQTTLDGGRIYTSPTEEILEESPYNTTFLHANERGCGSCHADLAKTLNNMEWPHVDLSNGYGIEITLPMCQSCHKYGIGYMSNKHAFGSIIHGAHEDVGVEIDCWSCHIAPDSTQGMQMWDNVKYTQLRGITAVPAVEGDFSYSQDKITPNDALFDYSWLAYDNDFLRKEKTEANAELDQQTFENWTVTVSGAVDKEITMTLPELVDTFGTESTVATLNCVLDPVGGPLIQNCEYTGVSVSRLLEAAGVSEDGAVLQILSTDGYSQVMDIDKAASALLGLQVNGETLPWNQGYPVVMVAPGAAAPAWTKEVSDIVVLTEEEATGQQEWKGFPSDLKGNKYEDVNAPLSWHNVDDDTIFLNKPHTAFFNFQNGQIIETGKPYEFTGYATAYDEGIAAIEFSMDNGINWTRYETPGTDPVKWVTWSFSYTPPEDSAYVLSVRAITETGRVSYTPAEMMFNAKASA